MYTCRLNCLISFFFKGDYCVWTTPSQVANDTQKNCLISYHSSRKVFTISAYYDRQQGRPFQRCQSCAQLCYLHCTNLWRYSCPGRWISFSMRATFSLGTSNGSTVWDQSGDNRFSTIMSTLELKDSSASDSLPSLLSTFWTAITL